MEVARHGFDPGVGHTNDRFPEITIGEADGLEHSPGSRLIAPVRDTATAMFEVHFALEIMNYICHFERTEKLLFVRAGKQQIPHS
jgi:hypothetical protein